MNATHDLAPLLQQFFLDRLIQQKNASTRTVENYRDTFRLLLTFAQRQLKKKPESLTLEDFNAAFILRFLKYLEQQRHNSIRSRNNRCAAIRSFMHYAALRVPQAAELTHTVLNIPTKRFERPLIGFVSREHMQAIIQAPDASTASGQRDRLMFAMLYNTGARVSELTAMRVADLSFDAGPVIRIHGKGRKERSVPLWSSTATELKRWLHKFPRAPEQPLFPNRRGTALTRIAVNQRLQLAARRAAERHPQFSKQSVCPHRIRHGTAMSLLQAGVDITAIALWLGHESPLTTHMYVEADLKMKEQALKKLKAPRHAPIRYRPPDRLLAFLQGL